MKLRSAGSTWPKKLLGQLTALSASALFVLWVLSGDTAVPQTTERQAEINGRDTDTQRPWHVELKSVVSNAAMYNLLWRQKTNPQLKPRAAVLCSAGHTVPSVFLLGGTKAGTTSLYHTFSQSVPFLDPGRNLSDEEWWLRKEKLFWSNRFQKGKKWYQSHYQTCPGMSPTNHQADPSSWAVYLPVQPGYGSGPFQAAVDMSANTLQDSASAARIREAYGTQSELLTFIIMMKPDPVDVVHSSMYMGMREEGLAQTSQNYAMKAFQEVKAARDCESRNLSYAQDCARLQTHNLRQAVYADLLEMWLTHFRPRQFVLVSAESYFDNPHRVVAEMAEVLGVPFSFQEVDFKQKLSNQRWNNVNPLKPVLSDDNLEATELLRTYFAPHRAKLSTLLRKHVLGGEMRFVGKISSFIDDL